MTAAPVPVPRPVPTPAHATTAQPVNRTAPGPRVAASKPSKLGEVKSGLLATAKRMLFFGVRGIGKSSLAADAPAPIFFDLGNATEHLNVARYPLPADPKYTDVLDAIDDIENGTHSYRTLVIEDVGELESLLHRHLVATAPVDKSGDRPESIEGFGFGKGYTLAEGEFRALAHRLDRLRLKRSMHVVMLGHSTIATLKNPTGDNYDRHVPLIHAKAFGVLGANADVVGFVTFDDVVKRMSGPAKKSIGVTGHRVIHLEHAAAWDAKSRLPLPAMIDLQEESPWAPFAAAIEQLAAMTPPGLRAQIDAELVRVGDPFVKADGNAGEAAKVRAAVAKAGDDVNALVKYLTSLQQAQPIAAPVTTENTTATEESAP
jgi:hypothetical protein